MNKSSASLLVSIVETTVYIRISGRANFVSSIDFKRLVHELSQRGYERFVLDLSECLIMDSTFLGVLAGIGLKMSAANHTPGAPTSVALLNPNSRVSDLLENLGVSHLFRVIQSNPAPKATFVPAAPSTATPTNADLARTCLEAHTTLMALNPENAAKFKDVAEFLAEDLKRIDSRK